VKFQIGKRVQKTELTGRSPLRRRRSALDYSVIEKEEDRGEEEDEEEEKMMMNMIMMMMMIR
jgi:hypothetical protein